jgi:hypothetical protein
MTLPPAAGALCRVLRRIGGEELVNQVRASVASHFPETSDHVTEFFSVIEDWGGDSHFPSARHFGNT